MMPRLAIGIGCRKGCSGDAVAGLVRRALAMADLSEQEMALFTSEAKRGEAGLAAAAAALGLDLVLLSHAALLAAAPRCVTHSLRVEALTGLPSLAEAAALAGAGAASRLILPRISKAGASCAIAIQEGLLL